ncbi:acid protease [Acephala macrosclerotiorum]|nr:acid protease [Acephala macrosclerotiorum]
MALRMFSFLAIAALLQFFGVASSTLRLPLQGSHHKLHEAVQKRALQSPLRDDGSSDASGHLTSPLKEGGQYLTLTPISIGTPPQNFTTIVSLIRPDLFVISSLNTAKSLENRTHYNSSLSSTYLEIGTSGHLDFPVAQGEGRFSKDNISIGDVTVARQVFLEAAKTWSGEETWYSEYEGMLGLGFGDNIVAEMCKQGLIEENVFTLEVPREENGVGELLIGGVPEIEENIVWVEMTDKSNNLDERYRQFKQWGIDTSSISFGSPELNISMPKRENATPAWIETDLMWIALPGDLVRSIHKHIEANRLGWSEFFGVDCEGRDWYPDLSFRVGKEEVEVNVTAWDYTWPIKMGEGDNADEMCISSLIDGPFDDVFLGMGFLRGFGVTFDGERERIGLSKRNHGEGS